tara:strand:+ start:179 stop:967 length:789 start_codon:yes stop_codon:yes gene_type:complete
MSDIAAITCFSNLRNAPSEVENFIKFKERLNSQGVPVFTIEVVPEGETPKLSKICKEGYFLERILLPALIEGNALNVLSSKVPRQYKKIAWLNSDILISDNDWPKKASYLLEECKLVRLSGELKHKSPSVVNRDFFEKVGVFDLDFSNTSDLVTYICSIHHNILSDQKKLLDLYKEKNLDIFYRILSYRSKCYDYFKQEIKTLDMKVESLSKENPIPQDDLIKLLGEIDFNSHVDYQGVNKIIAFKNIYGFKYPNKLLSLLK